MSAMKADLLLSSELIGEIAKRLGEELKLYLNGKGHDKPEDVILNVKDLAEYLKVSTKWIYERTHLKEIPHLKIDGHLRFRKSDIDKWLLKCNVPCRCSVQKGFKACKMTPDRYLMTVKGFGIFPGKNARLLSNIAIRI